MGLATKLYTYKDLQGNTLTLLTAMSEQLRIWAMKSKEK